MARLRKHNPSEYRSGLEDDTVKLLESLGVPFEYETVKLPYQVPASDHTYTPDFKVTTKSGKVIYIETKGIWIYKDRYKHLLIRQQHPDLDIRFVFTRAKQKISKASKTTYADICEGKGRAPFKGVVWQYADKRIPLEWLEE